MHAGGGRQGGREALELIGAHLGRGGDEVGGDGHARRERGLVFEVSVSQGARNGQDMQHAPVGDPASLWGEEEGDVVSTCMQRHSGSSARMRSTHRVLDEGGNQGSSELIQHAPRP